jgi:glycosyltransferase involved in cell wall biosynthesis
VSGAVNVNANAPTLSTPQASTSKRVRGQVAFFDGIGAAHSFPLIAGLDDAAARAGLRRQWTTALRPPGVADEMCEWNPGRAFYAEFCATGRASSVAYRAAWQRAVDRAEKSGCAFFCDLGIEHLTASYGAPLRVGMPAVWVVHQPPPPRDSRALPTRAKVVAANPRRWRRLSRHAHARSVLHRLARGHSRFVVPSTPARDRLAQIVEGDRIVVAPWPVVSAAVPPPLADDAPSEPTAVFPGEARVGKGLDVLLAALAAVPDLAKIDLPSVIAADAQALVRRTGDPRVAMGTTWASNEAYQAQLRAATLAVVPYPAAAAANGGISASLLDALAIGLPVVITEPIARLLPAGYGGAIVVRPGAPDALADGIRTALRDIDRLRAHARVEGPAFVVANHSYEQYLDTIVAAGAG